MTASAKPKTNKRSLIVQVNQITGRTQADCSAVLECLLDELVHHMHKGRTVAIRGFGSFYTKDRAARTGMRNPKTGDPATLPRRRVMLARIKV